MSKGPNIPICPAHGAVNQAMVAPLRPWYMLRRYLEPLGGLGASCRVFSVELQNPIGRAEHLEKEARN